MSKTNNGHTLKLLALTTALSWSGVVLAANPPLDYSSVVNSDADLNQKINQQILADRNLSAKDWEDLNVAVKNGKVVLSGTVTTDAALKEVKQIARQNSSNVEDYALRSEETIERERTEGSFGL